MLLLSFLLFPVLNESGDEYVSDKINSQHEHVVKAPKHITKAQLNQLKKQRRLTKKQLKKQRKLQKKQIKKAKKMQKKQAKLDRKAANEKNKMAKLHKKFSKK